jgi:antitoxin VapB
MSLDQEDRQPLDRSSIVVLAMLAYTYVYAKGSEVDIMQRTAKIFMNNRSQAVRLPKEFQFATSEVFIRKQGDDVVLSARPEDWSAYLTSGPVASEEFMEGIENLPVQER